MIIDQLPSVGTPSLTDETVTEQGQNLFKVTWQRLLSLFKGNTTLSELSNDAGFVNATQAAAAAPVQSVDGRTGAVTTLSSTMPSPLGTATPGTADYAARADHVHAMPSADDVGAMSKWDLLWENASPTSDFAAQTITLPSNDCDFYYIRTIRDKNATTDIISPIFLKVGEKGFVRFEAGSGGIQSGSIIAYSREVTMTSATQVDFAAGYIFGYTSATRNDLSIPYQIYGIKGVQ